MACVGLSPNPGPAELCGDLGTSYVRPAAAAHIQSQKRAFYRDNAAFSATLSKRLVTLTLTVGVANQAFPFQLKASMRNPPWIEPQGQLASRPQETLVGRRVWLWRRRSPIRTACAVFCSLCSWRSLFTSGEQQLLRLLRHTADLEAPPGFLCAQSVLRAVARNAGLLWTEYTGQKHKSPNTVHHV